MLCDKTFKKSIDTVIITHRALYKKALFPENEKGISIHLRKVSTHVSLCSLHRHTCAKTFCYAKIFCTSTFFIVIHSVFKENGFYG